jgi:SAM-dependent methyltransferase
MSYFNHLHILQCPVTGEDLHLADETVLKRVNDLSSEDQSFQQGLVNAGATIFYPVINEILLLLPHYRVSFHGEKQQEQVSFDRQRIFNYFKEIGYYEFEGQQIYEDADQFVDFRPFLKDYTSMGFANTGKYLPASGNYFADIACGPVAFKEFVQLAANYKCRICVDLSLNSLQQARKNLQQSNQPYLLICADMLHLPLKENIADAVICQHALFHVPKDDQLPALKQLVRVAKPDAPVAIVYDWFYYSWFMNIALGPVQLYRIARHIAGKWYARMFKKNKLYFYAHAPRWFRKNNPGRSIQFFTWRSINIYFSRMYLHNNAVGRRILKWVMHLEKKYPEKMGKLGEYGIILIRK